MLHKKEINQLAKYYLQDFIMAEDDHWKNITERGLQAAYPDRSHSLSEHQSPQKELSLQRSMSERSVSIADSSINRPLFPGMKKVEIKKEDHTIRNILCMVIFLLLTILSIDIKNDIEREWHKHELQAKHCFAEYTQNECEHPIDAMRARCKQLQICYSTKIDHKIKISSILANLVGQAVNKCTSSAGLAGSIFLMCLICAILFFAYKSSKATLTLKKD